MTYTAWFDEIGKEDSARVGGKGANLGELSHAGLPVPLEFIITTGAYDAFVESNEIGDAIVKLVSVPRAGGPTAFEEVAGRIHALFSGGKVPEKMAEEIRGAYEKLDEDGGTAVAVRSSATAEDLAGASFAGHQETYLNVRGAEALLEAVKNCWASLWMARAIAYRAHQGIDPAIVSLAVVVQRMVESEAAGVMFTANPANGRRNEAAISAAWGLGEAVVSGSVTPDSIVVEKASGRVISREISDKAFMTVYTESGTAERPVPEARRRKVVLDEQMPDPLSPLFADLIEGSVVRSLDKIMNELLGANTLREGDLGFPIINGYAYYYYKLAPMLRFVPKSPLIIRFITGSGEVNGVKRWREYARPLYAGTVEEWEAKPPEDLPATGLLAGTRELLDAGAEYYTSVQTIIPLAYISEALFTAFYNRLVRRQGDPPAQTFLLGFDSTPIWAEKSLYDLAMWCSEHPELAAALKGTPSDRELKLLHTEEPPSGVDEETWHEWRSRFQAHLDRYGHAVYNLDFVNPVPADDPAPLLDTLKFYLRGEGQNPHERQRGMVRRREEATRAVLEQLDPA